MTYFENFVCQQAIKGNYIYVHKTFSDSELDDNNYHLSINNENAFTSTSPPKVLISPIIHKEKCNQNVYVFKTTLNLNFASKLNNYKLHLCTQFGAGRGGRAGSISAAGISYLSSKPLFTSGDASVNTPAPAPPAPPSGSCLKTVVNGFPNQTISMYRILNNKCWKSMDLLRKQACSKGIRVNRIYLAFFNPTIQYKSGDGLKAEYLPDFLDNPEFQRSPHTAFTYLKQWITQMKTAGVEIYLTMGGWNYNCFPNPYMIDSVGGYGTSTPNFWKIKNLVGGDRTKCTLDNQYCYVCEDKGQIEDNNDLATAMSIFPELESISSASSVWMEAQTKVNDAISANANACSDGSTTKPPASPCPANQRKGKDLIPTSTYTEGSVSTTVPGYKVEIDPYGSIVDLAIDLGATGIDVDYEEMWHADKYKDVAAGGDATLGPWTLYETVYKYATIVQTIMLHIQKKQPSLYISTTPGAAGAVPGYKGGWNFWGGNLKGVWGLVSKIFPDIWAKLTEHDGLNVMTYDLSKDQTYHECPTTDSASCQLPAQVKYYMGTFDALKSGKSGSMASVGFELGAPAYPGCGSNAVDDRLYATESNLKEMLPNFTDRNLFYWQWGKPPDTNNNTISEDEFTSKICNNMPSEYMQSCKNAKFIPCEGCDPVVPICTK